MVVVKVNGVMCWVLIDSGACGSCASAKLISTINKQLSKVKKPELLSIRNPGYDKLICEHDHLRTITIDDDDAKQQLLIHLVLGNGEYACIKTSTKPLVGRGDREACGQENKIWLGDMSPGIDFDCSMMFLTQMLQSDFESLCRLDILGLADSMENDQNIVYDDFKERLVRDPSGFYKVNLPWETKSLQVTNKRSW